MRVYALDALDRIASVDAGWDGFALANGGPDACAASVLGSPLAAAIADEPTRRFMDALLARVRARGEAETVRYRCDSAGVIRRFRMVLSPLPEDGVRVEHRPEGARAAAIRVRVRPAGRGRPAVFRCSVCCRIREHVGWRDPFESYLDRDLAVHHVICDDCARSAGVVPATLGWMRAEPCVC